MVISDGADEVALIIVTVCVRVPIVASSGGPATVNTFQAEDEVFVCHIAGAPVLSEGSAVKPELLCTCSKGGPAKEERERWVARLRARALSRYLHRGDEHMSE